MSLTWMSTTGHRRILVIPNLSPKEAIDCAWETTEPFRDQIANLERVSYHESIFGFDKVWVVMYRHINPLLLPNEFLVIVDDATGHAVVPPHV
jgi:hypothetical protein